MRGSDLFSYQVAGGQCTAGSARRAGADKADGDEGKADGDKGKADGDEGKADGDEGKADGDSIVRLLLANTSELEIGLLLRICPSQRFEQRVSCSRRDTLFAFVIPGNGRQ